MKIIKNIAFIIILLLNAELVFSQWELTHTFYGLNGLTTSDISFSDPQHGWVAYSEYISPSSGNILHVENTTDYGNTWNPISGFSSADYPNVIEIISTHKDTVYCFVHHEWGSHYNFSYDAGNEWELVYFGQETHICDAFLLNSDTGYLIMESYNTNLLIRFTQGNQLDTLVNLDTLNVFYSRMFFVNSSIGYLTARDSINNSILLFTDNGGNSWTVNNTTSEYVFNNIYFNSDSIGYIICWGGQILKTTDYGASLIELASPTTNYLSDIQFVNDSSGYCIGSEGTIINTIDYGLTWFNDYIGTNDYLTKIQMFGFDNGYILSHDDGLFSKNNMVDAFSIIYEPFSIYPNPTSNYIHFAIYDNRTIEDISIYKLLGKKMLIDKLDFSKVDISSFDSGLYIINITIDNTRYIKKIIKK